MTFQKIALTLAALAALALAAPALAQDADPNLAGPFAYAESHQKAEDRAAAEAAGGAGRVIGGELAAEGAWPWQVALLIKGEPVGPDAQFCGGSLVLDNWVLTAAHCIHMPDDSGTFRDIPAGRIQVLAGSNRLAPGLGDLIDVVGIFRHPDYVGTLFDFDIALVKLARAPRVPYQTITVPDAGFGEDLDQPGVPTIVTGWGLVNGGDHPADMYQTQIQVMAREMCNDAIMEARADAASEGFLEATQTFALTEEATDEVWAALLERAPLPLSDNMICSGSFEGGKTSCQGDSGGPLVVALDDGSYIQAGVVSWGLTASSGKTCAEDAPFSAYTKISNFVPWLEATINAN